jgi:general secretion pathway protein K
VRRAARGAALVVALLVVAVVTLLAVTLSSDFLLLFRRVENQLHGEQAHSYLRGAEGVARAVLLQDLLRGNARDSLDEPWQDELQFATDFGWIAGRLHDVQGRFNLNALGQSAAPAEGGYSVAQERFIRLLQALPLEEKPTLEEAQAIAEAVTDWIDADDTVSGFGGAESDYYARVEPASGRPANRAIASPSELRWVKGMRADVYRALEPLVTAWPALGGGININTAPPPVLASINARGDLQPLAQADLETLLEARGETGFDDVAAAFSGGPFEGREIDVGDLGVGSNYFMLEAETEFMGRPYRLYSLLRRNPGDNSVRVIARSYGEW